MLPYCCGSGWPTVTPPAAHWPRTWTTRIWPLLTPLMGPTSPRTTTEDSTPTFHTFQVMKSMIKINKKDFAQNECYLAKNSQRKNLTMYLFLILSNEKILEKQKHQICSVSAKKSNSGCTKCSFLQNRFTLNSYPSSPSCTNACILFTNHVCLYLPRAEVWKWLTDKVVLSSPSGGPVVQSSSGFRPEATFLVRHKVFLPV